MSAPQTDHPMERPSYRGSGPGLDGRVAPGAEPPIRQLLVWRKDAMVVGDGDYHYAHEPIAYARKPGKGRHRLQIHLDVHRTGGLRRAVCGAWIGDPSVSVGALVRSKAKGETNVCSLANCR